VADSPEAQLKNELKLDFYYPVLDAITVSLQSRFNAESVIIVEHISSVLSLNDKFESSVKQLSLLARLDGDLCVAEGKMVLANENCKSSDGIITLQRISSSMVQLKHSVVYKNFFRLIVFLLTLPVTSASCERAHSKVDLIKSAVLASMSSERLEDLVTISSEKSLLDSLDPLTIVDRFALRARGLKL